MRRLILWLNLIAPPVALALWLLGSGWLPALLTLAGAHALWLWATLVPGCSWWGAVFRELPGGAREIWLTIDDGPDPEDTPRLLGLLDKHGAKASFFVIGERAQRHPELIREITRRGHELGNHTWRHPAGWFWCLGRRRIGEEIEQCSTLLRQIVPEIRLRWFRAPAGMRNHHVHPCLHKAGLELAGWSARGRDGVLRDKDKILNLLRRGVAPGAVLLMHEGRVDHHGQRLAPQVLAELLIWLKQQGYACVLPSTAASGQGELASSTPSLSPGREIPVPIPDSAIHNGRLPLKPDQLP